MLDVKKDECHNEIIINGLLNELDIVESTTRDGKPYVHGTAKIQVDQEIDGKVVESEIPVKMIAFRYKNDNTLNPRYDRILGYKDIFTSVRAADDAKSASYVSVIAKVRENNWYSDRINDVISSTQFLASFLNKKRPEEEELAVFKIQGVVAKMIDEVDKNGEETGRMKISLVVVGWGGTPNVVELIAEGSRKTFFENNWNQGDTVIATGRVIYSYKVVEWEEEQGFGEPIKRHKTESRRELYITGGSPCGADEALSYDADSIKLLLKDRTKKIEEIREMGKNKNKPSTTNRPSTTFDDF